jgi:hypothetical protein
MIPFVIHYFSLQKIGSIFFISLLAFFHYGKALSYLHCVIENTISTGSVYCDCEKQIKDNTDNTQSGAAQKATLKEKMPENLFTCSKHLLSLAHETESPSIMTSNSSRQISTGFHRSIFQPPKG